MSIDVGARLRSVRTSFGLSQRELARRAGVTNGLISLIEQNRVSPSVSSLKKVLDGVPMSLAEFFTLDLSAAPQAFFGAEELVELGNAEVSLRLVAAQRPGRQLTLLHERYAAGAATGEEMLAHRGEEGGRRHQRAHRAYRRRCDARARARRGLLFRQPAAAPLPQRRTRGV